MIRSFIERTYEIDEYVRSMFKNDEKPPEQSNGTDHVDFLEQLFDNRKMPTYHLPMTIKVELRPYQYVSKTRMLHMP
jgi:hypothetical protein